MAKISNVNKDGCSACRPGRGKGKGPPVRESEWARGRGEIYCQYICGDSCVTQATLIPPYPLVIPFMHLHHLVLCYFITIHLHFSRARFPHSLSLREGYFSLKFFPAHRPPVASAMPAHDRHRYGNIPYAKVNNLILVNTPISPLCHNNQSCRSLPCLHRTHNRNQHNVARLALRVTMQQHEDVQSKTMKLSSAPHSILWHFRPVHASFSSPLVVVVPLFVSQKRKKDRRAVALTPHLLVAAATCTTGLENIVEVSRWATSHSA